jgi:outer membrane receptor protein involved in Fe transport
VEDIERIEVVRGPGSALYGADAFNGVINIITKAPGEGRSGFNVGYGDHNTRTAPSTRAVATRSSPTASAPDYDYLPRWSSIVPRSVD